MLDSFWILILFAFLKIEDGVLFDFLVDVLSNQKIIDNLTAKGTQPADGIAGIKKKRGMEFGCRIRRIDEEVPEKAESTCPNERDDHRYRGSVQAAKEIGKCIHPTTDEIKRQQ